MRVSSVSRRFVVRHDRPATLKDRVLRRNAGPPTTFLNAVQDVSFTVHPGESVGLVGRNGSGKSTLLKMLAGIIPPHEGQIGIGGSIASMLELGSGFHPDFTGRENVFMNGAIHGLSEREVRRRLDEIVDFAELEDFIDMPVRTYSTGMQMRLAFAVAAHVNPDVLLLDEVLAVGDGAFQSKCVSRIESFLSDGGTLIFVSHASGAVAQICSRALLLESGRLIADGPSEDVLKEYDWRVKNGESHAGGAFQDGLQTPLVRPGGSLHGSAATILSMGARNSEGQRLSKRIVAGDIVVMEFEIKVDRPTNELDLAVHLRNSKAQEVLATCSAEGRLRLRGTPGVHVCRASIPLPLQEDTIEVSAAIRDRITGEVFDHAFLPDGIAIRRALPGAGMIAVPVEWSMGSDAHATPHS